MTKSLPVYSDQRVGNIGTGILALTLLVRITKMVKIPNFSDFCCGTGILMIILVWEKE
jgi:tRNA1(Val) A37 N6-methylase TrmN6